MFLVSRSSLVPQSLRSPTTLHEESQEDVFSTEQNAQGLQALEHPPTTLQEDQPQPPLRSSSPAETVAPRDTSLVQDDYREYQDLFVRVALVNWPLFWNEFHLICEIEIICKVNIL